MAGYKQIQLSPKTAENTEFERDSSVSLREFRVLRKAVNGAQASLSVLGDQIQLKASQSSVDSLSGRVTTAESSITVNAQQIALKVSSTDYNGNTIASLINQTATTIKLSASKIDLFGYVTINNLETAGATTINGSNITTGVINANLITTGALSADRISGGTINGSTISVINLNASNIITGSLSVNRLTVGTVSGWYFGDNTISRNRITLGDNYIRLVGTSTSDATINFENTNNSGDVVRLYKVGNFGLLGVSGGLDISGGVTCSGLVTGEIGLNGDMRSNNIYPNVHSTSASTGYRLGNSARSWREVWAFDTTINTSDKRLKREIEQLDKGIELILKLNPVQFKWNDGSRKHYGLIAQEVKQAMTDVGIDDSAIYVDANIRDGVDTVALRYGELIAPMIQTIQMLSKKVEMLERTSNHKV